jgi:ubiquinone/menaquinone biosynthesis C-methylase UbiE
MGTKKGLKNAYFIIDDEKNNKIYDFTIPEIWWSRLYEYVWVKQHIKENEIVVDAGSGPNYPLQYVLAETCKVYSIDIDQNILKSKKHPNITHIVADIADTKLSENSIDTIYCVSVFEHLTKEKAVIVLKEFYRILKPEGLIVLTMDMAIAGDCRYTWISEPDDFFKIVPSGFLYGEYEGNPPQKAIKDDKHGLYCYHTILQKVGDL